MHVWQLQCSPFQSCMDLKNTCVYIEVAFMLRWPHTCSYCSGKPQCSVCSYLPHVPLSMICYSGYLMCSVVIFL